MTAGAHLMQYKHTPALRDKFGPRCYRIRQRGEVEVYGTMPNTGAVGWYFFGYIEDMPYWFDLED